MSRLDLRDLDRRLVPATAAGLRRLLDAGARTRGRLARQARRAGVIVAAALRRADDRVLSTGSLSVLRDVPQLGLLVVAAVFVAGSAAAVRLGEPDPVPPPPSAANAGLDSIARLGPPPGSEVELYLEQSRVVLDDVAGRLPTSRFLAVVHLARHVAAADVPIVFAGADVQRLYLRASTAGPDAEIVALPVSGSAPDTVLAPLCAATSARKAEDARSFTTLADSIEPTTPDQQASKADFQAESTRSAAESQAYAGACETTFAAVVEAPAEVLQQLLGRDGVRGVELAPAGIALADLDVQPLLPETTGTVPTGRER